jgi:hypothetical protein
MLLLEADDPVSADVGYWRLTPCVATRCRRRAGPSPQPIHSWTGNRTGVTNPFGFTAKTSQST